LNIYLSILYQVDGIISLQELTRKEEITIEQRKPDFLVNTMVNQFLSG